MVLTRLHWNKTKKDVENTPVIALPTKIIDVNFFYSDMTIYMTM